MSHSLSETAPPSNSTEIVPYASEARQIVLRHKNKVVVYDEKSKQLSAQPELGECPLCHRPFSENAHLNDEESDGEEPDFVNPEYFRRLDASRPESQESSGPPSPSWRLVGPASAGSDSPRSGASLLAVPSLKRRTAAADAGPHGISSEAFSQGYFKRFFKEEGVLGQGGKGVVLLVSHYLDKVFLGKFACKRVPVGDNHEWLERVLWEVRFLQGLSHQNLVSYRHVWLENYGASLFRPSTPHIFILQQYCNSGTLLDYVLGPKPSPDAVKQRTKDRARRLSRDGLHLDTDMGAPRRLPFDEIFAFFRDITAGLAYLHGNDYVHRDLKPQNCLLHMTGASTRILVSDFGEMQGAGIDRGPTATGYTGTIAFAAPEVLKRDERGKLGKFTKKSDVFSLGQVTYFMCFGRLPYPHADLQDENEDLDQLKAEIIGWTGLHEERRERADLPEELYLFLTVLLSHDPEKRPDTDEILQRAERAGSGFGDHVSPRTTTNDHDQGIPSSQPSSPVEEPGLKRRNVRQGKGTTNRRGSAEAGYFGSVLPSPSKRTSNPPFPSVAEDDPDSDISRDDRSPEHRRIKDRKSPPLLLPPPERDWWRSWARVFGQPRIASLARATLLLLKIWSLMWPCSPAAPKPFVAYPVLLTASLDLTGSSAGWLQSAILVGLHCLVTFFCWKTRALCEPLYDE